MILRQAEKKLRKLASQFPVVGMTGPRQSGKTTLARKVFANHAYVTFENPDIRELFFSDPRLFFKAYSNDYGIIIDEIQEAPSALSYIQGIVDEAYRPGYFIVTGSQNILMLEKVSQTLAGRIALLTLLPLTVDELRQAHLLPSLEELLLQGCYPRVYAQAIDSADWFLHYRTTYVERDVRQIINIGNLTAFQNLLKLCAGRVGQLLNYSDLANNCGISVNTVKSWISVLEATYIIRLLQPYYKNFNKRVTKSPKLYFYDTGLLCSLLGIRDPSQLFTHPSRGALFETLIINELIKYRINEGLPPDVFFWRDSQGHEIDCIIEDGPNLTSIEIKSGLTIVGDFFAGLQAWRSITKEQHPSYLVYAGEKAYEHKYGRVVPWNCIKKIYE